LLRETKENLIEDIRYPNWLWDLNRATQTRSVIHTYTGFSFWILIQKIKFHDTTMVVRIMLRNICIWIID
jgi:hypothetical protein